MRSERNAPDLSIPARILLKAALLVFASCPALAADEPALSTGKPARGAAFLASAVGKDLPAEEVEAVVRTLRLDFVVFDFAWVTYHFGRTDFSALDALSKKLGAQGAVVAAMYRPRALNPSQGPESLARDEHGKVAESHNELCFAGADAVEWGAKWGDDILRRLPSLDHILLYNVRPVCRCEDCAGGAGAGHCDAFLKACRERWRRIRPGVEIGHVGGGLEYAGHLDFFCPFLPVQRTTDAEPVDAKALAEASAALAARAGGRPVIPLVKVCWESETRNDTRDIVEVFRAAETAGTGCLLWYYGWIFHPDGGRYDPRALVEGLGGSWERLSRFFQEGGKEKEPAAPLSSDWVFFPSREDPDGPAPRISFTGAGRKVDRASARADSCILSYMPALPGGRLPRLSIMLGDQNRVLLAFDVPRKGPPWNQAWLELDLRLPERLAARGTLTLAVHPVREPWNESTTCWNNQPAFTEKAAVVQKLDAVPGPVKIDLTTIVRAWASGRAPNHGILLKVLEPVRTASPPSAGGPRSLASRLAALVPWKTSAAEALREAAASRRPVLTCVLAEGQDLEEQLLNAFVFTDPAAAGIARRRFVPLRVTYSALLHSMAGTPYARSKPDPLAPLGFTAAAVRTPALCVSSSDGRAVASLESIGTFDSGLVTRFFLDALQRCSAPLPEGLEGPIARLEAGDLEGAGRESAKSGAAEKAVLRARVAALKGDHEEAVRQAREATRGRSPEASDAAVLAGASLLRLGRFDEARRELEAALKRSPAPSAAPQARYLLGLLAHARRDPAESRRLWEETARDQDGSPWALRAACALAWPTRLGFETLAALSPPAGPHATTERPVAADDLDGLVERAAAYLLDRQEADGSWPFLDEEKWRIGVTALAAQALLGWAAALPADARSRARAAADRAETFLLRHIETADPATADSFGASYTLGFLLDRLAAAPGADRKGAAERAAAFLVGGQCPGGAWSYDRRFGTTWRGGGSWPKTDRGRVHSMNTGLALMVLARAKALGVPVDAAALTAGVKALKEMRVSPGVYTYTFPDPRNFEKEDQSIARGPVCEHALFLLGAAGKEDLAASLDAFRRFRKDLRTPVKMTAGWVAPRCFSAYFFCFATYHAALAARDLGGEFSTKLLSELRADLLAVPELDGTWVDWHQAGKAYGTAMALLVLRLERAR